MSSRRAVGRGATESSQSYNIMSHHNEAQQHSPQHPLAQQQQPRVSSRRVAGAYTNQSSFSFGPPEPAPIRAPSGPHASASSQNFNILTQHDAAPSDQAYRNFGARKIAVNGAGAGASSVPLGIDHSAAGNAKQNYDEHRFERAAGSRFSAKKPSGTSDSYNILSNQAKPNDNNLATDNLDPYYEEDDEADNAYLAQRAAHGDRDLPRDVESFSQARSNNNGHAKPPAGAFKPPRPRSDNPCVPLDRDIIEQRLADSREVFSQRFAHRSASYQPNPTVPVAVEPVVSSQAFIPVPGLSRRGPTTATHNATARREYNILAFEGVELQQQKGQHPSARSTPPPGAKGGFVHAHASPTKLWENVFPTDYTTSNNTPGAKSAGPVRRVSGRGHTPGGNSQISFG